MTLSRGNLAWGLLLIAGCTAAGASNESIRSVDGTAPVDELATLPPADTQAGTKADTQAGIVADDLGELPLPDLAAFRRDGTVVRVRDGHAAVDDRKDAGPGLVGLDGRTLVEAAAGGADATEVRWTNLFTGETTGVASIADARVVPTVTDGTGRYVALVSEADGQPDGAIAPGRASSTIVIADRDLGERYRTTLEGNFHPEAFGISDGPDGVPDTVYVLEYLPADAPTHYRVRVLQTATGDVGLPVNLRDKASQVDATMAGVSRTQVVSDHDGGLLFTLYRGVAGEGDRHGYAFVHTLGLAGGVWCLDIAHEMELDTQPGALVVAGDRLVVASANGTIGSYDIAAVLDPAREPVMDAVPCTSIRRASRCWRRPTIGCGWRGARGSTSWTRRRWTW
ncbi:MAG TPA: hypothetical protein VFV63_08275 [Ilumatobacteraceae bacterium]|nr:hypothetical protein [Ilumatobacteraceae bacterium]